MLVPPKIKKIGCALALLLVVTFAWFVGLFNRGTLKAGVRLEPVAKLTHSKMEEVSGLVKSSYSPELLWAHNDSGNEPRLFCVSSQGKLVVPDPIRLRKTASDPEFQPEPFDGLEVTGASLQDWEAITRVGETLYISELGNNLNASRHLGFYLVEEPDPHKDETIEPARFVGVFYPEQTNFPPRDRWAYDCEAVFATEEALYCLTKNRPAFRPFVQDDSSDLYRLSLENLGEQNKLTKVDRVDGLGGWVTGCDLSSDGEWLALVCESPQQSIWLFQKPLQGDKFFTQARQVKRFVFHGGGQVECLAFAEYEGDEVLVMLNEEKELFRISLDMFGEVQR